MWPALPTGVRMVLLYAQPQASRSHGSVQMDPEAGVSLLASEHDEPLRPLSAKEWVEIVVTDIPGAARSSSPYPTSMPLHSRAIPIPSRASEVCV